jgi:hypothetical protein
MATLVNKQFVPIGNKTTATTTGRAPGFVAAGAGGDFVPLTGYGVLVQVKNAGGSPVTVTVDSVAPSSYGTDQDITVTVPATTGDMAFVIRNDGRFDQGGANAGLAKLTYSGVTSVTVDATVIPG